MQATIKQTEQAKLPYPLRAILPGALTQAVLECAAPWAEELRLHADRDATLTCGDGNYRLAHRLDERAVQDVLLKMCQGSLYAYSQTINQGYLTMAGGIRVGVCGTAATEGDTVIGIRSVRGLIIRIPHAVPVDASPILERLRAGGGLLIYAPPGVGKTTLLRAVARGAASPPHSKRTVVVDTRGELRFSLDSPALLLDILEGYPRALGIEIAVRSLGAQLIVCDEIGNTADAHAVLEAANCGVPLIASTHAASVDELMRRPAMYELIAHGVFRVLVGLSRIGDRFLYRFDTCANALGGHYAHA